MVSPSISLIIILLACCSAVIVGSTSPAALQAQDNVLEICERCRFGENWHEFFSLDFCVETLLSDPRSQTADLKLFGLISLEYVSDVYNETVPYIQELIEKKWDKNTTVTLQSCLETYKISANDLAKSVELYKQKYYKQASDLLRMEFGGWHCDTLLQYQWGDLNPNPMTGRTKYVQSILDVALGIVIAATQ